jgi:hypothetical protein
LAIGSAARDGEAHELPRQIELVGEAMLEAGALDVLLARSEHERASLWAARRDMSHAMRRQARHKLSEDVVVPRTRIGALLDRCSALSEQHGVRVATYGHALVARVHELPERHREVAVVATRAIVLRVRVIRGRPRRVRRRRVAHHEEEERAQPIRAERCARAEHVPELVRERLFLVRGARGGQREPTYTLTKPTCPPHGRADWVQTRTRIGE